MTRRDAPTLLGLLVAFVTVRAWWLRDTFADRSLEPLEFGQLAHDLPAGLLAPLTSYLPQANEGCGLFFGFWCAPAMVVLGDSFLTLRLCQLAWHAVALSLLFSLGLRLGGRAGATAAAALYVLPAPGLATMMHRGWFNHLEVWVLLGAALVVHGQGRRRAAVAGLLLGLSVFFQLSALPAAAALAAVLWWRGPRRALALGGLVGALPWLLASWFGEPIAGSAASDLGGGWAVKALLLEHGPGLFGYRGGAPFGTSLLLGSGAGLTLLFAAGLGARGGDDRTLVYAAAAAGLAHLGACVTSGLDLAQARYLAPLWPWALLLLAGLGRGAWLPATALLLLHGAQLAAFDPGEDRMPPSFEGSMTGHSVLQHGGLRERLEGRGTDSLAPARARYDLCRLVGQGGGTIEAPWLEHPGCAAGAAYAGAAGDSPRARLGAFAAGIDHDGRALVGALEGADPLRCAAAGHWAFETGWHGDDVLGPLRRTCGDAAVAVGAGMALAPRLRPGAPTPRLGWWWRDPPPAPEAQDAFACAAAAERSAPPSAAPPPVPLRCGTPSPPPPNR